MICETEPIIQCMTCRRGVRYVGDICYVCRAIEAAGTRPWWSVNPLTLSTIIAFSVVAGLFMVLFVQAIKVNTRRIEAMHADTSAIAEARVEAMTRALEMRRK